MHIFHKMGHLVGGTLLVTGTSIGVGMLALPVATAEGGFFPSLMVYVVCWLFMLATGLLVMEACLWMPPGSNLITMATKLLGRGGQVFCWVVYLFLFTCLMVAHVAAGGSIVSQMSGHAIPQWLGTIIYLAVFSPAVYLGTVWVDRLNMGLMAGVTVTYFLFVIFAAGYVNVDLLKVMHFSEAWVALPVVFTAFGYQSLIPTLVTYMKRDAKKVRFAIICGTAIPLVIYIIWDLLVHGIIPIGGLVEALHKGQNAVEPLGLYIKNPIISKLGVAFGFFAMTTSMFGLSIAYMDFLADGFHLKRKAFNRILPYSIVFILPMLITWIDPTVFLHALNYAGGIGVALLLGAMPIAMVWAGRYYQKKSHVYQQVRGGKTVLAILMAFVVFELVIQLGFS